MAKIKVQNTEVTVITYNDKDYISLTDMVRNMENGPALIEKWLRNKNTVEFLGIWEEMYNPDFNSPEFEGIKNEAGLNRFILSVKQWVEKTNSKGIIAKAGRYGLRVTSVLCRTNSLFMSKKLKVHIQHVLHLLEV